MSEPVDWTNWLNHELKTPLNRMESLILSLKKSKLSGFSEQKIMMSLMSSLEECRSTIDSLFLFNKIQVDNIHLKLNHYDINTLVTQVCQDLDLVAEAKHVKFIIEAEPLFLIPLDEQLFKRALSNIITNAVKFSPNDSKILISTESINRKFYIQVADQGVGMDENELNKIFDPYYRVEQSSYIPGTGLGLFIAKSFMKSLNGKISVDSVKGAGTTFTMILDVDALEKINQLNEEKIDSSLKGEHAL